MSRPGRIVRACAVLATCAVLGAVTAWCGWNLGPARHLHAPALDPAGALGYGLLLALLRFVLAPVMAARSRTEGRSAAR